MTIKDELRTDDAIRIRRARNKRIGLGIPSTPVETSESAFDALERTGGQVDRRGMRAALVTHKSDPLITMYDADGMPRSVPEGSVRVCLSEGLFLECPICSGEHPDNSPNACPGRDAVKFRRCPVCGKRFFDDRASAAAMDDTEEGLIPTDLPATPEARTKAKVDAHMVVYHEDAARRAGLLTAAEVRR